MAVTALKPPTNERLVAHIKRLLDLAEKGEIVAMAEVTVFDNTSVDSGWVFEDADRATQPLKVLGALAVMQANLVDNLRKPD